MLMAGLVWKSGTHSVSSLVSHVQNPQFGGDSSIFRRTQMSPKIIIVYSVSSCIHSCIALYRLCWKTCHSWIVATGRMFSPIWDVGSSPLGPIQVYLGLAPALTTEKKNTQSAPESRSFFEVFVGSSHPADSTSAILSISLFLSLSDSLNFWFFLFY